jgi:hypothetical protein
MSVSQNKIVQYMILLNTLKNTNNLKMVQNMNDKMQYHKMYKNIENMNNIKNKRMNNNNMMRRNHNIKQPGYDVQRHNYRK